MYQLAYLDAMESGQEESRDGERAALEHAIELMERAERQGANHRDVVEAVLFTSKLWAVLCEDLASPSNELPKELRAQILSIGIWVLKEVDSIRLGFGNGFSDLIVVSKAIKDGLQ